MEVFQQMAAMGHERVLFCSSPEVGLRAIIAVHSTVLGPGLGGVRMWPYPSIDEALTDVLRLSRSMTDKAAAAGLHLGGGKAVILGDPRKEKSEALLRAFRGTNLVLLPSGPGPPRHVTPLSALQQRILTLLDLPADTYSRLSFAA